jgi:pSer/pThr/pTyr-binding forkhead associated (FHA) protein
MSDLSSANGTTVDGSQVGREPTEVQNGSTVKLADHRYHFVEA